MVIKLVKIFQDKEEVKTQMENQYKYYPKYTKSISDSAYLLFSELVGKILVLKS